VGIIPQWLANRQHYTHRANYKGLAEQAPPPTTFNHFSVVGVFPLVGIRWNFWWGISLRAPTVPQGRNGHLRARPDSLGVGGLEPTPILGIQYPVAWAGVVDIHLPHHVELDRTPGWWRFYLSRFYTGYRVTPTHATACGGLERLLGFHCLPVFTRPTFPCRLDGRLRFTCPQLHGHTPTGPIAYSTSACPCGRDVSPFGMAGRFRPFPVG